LGSEPAGNPTGAIFIGDEVSVALVQRLHAGTRTPTPVPKFESCKSGSVLTQIHCNSDSEMVNVETWQVQVFMKSVTVLGISRICVNDAQINAHIRIVWKDEDDYSVFCHSTHTPPPPFTNTHRRHTHTHTVTHTHTHCYAHTHAHAHTHTHTHTHTVTHARHVPNSTALTPISWRAPPQ
jgi:hypothetical protein